jgi:hypothetical protein
VSEKKAAKTEKTEPAPERSQVIRLKKGQAHRLGQIGEKFGTTQGQLVSWAIDALIAEVEAKGGKLVLPFVFPARTPEPFAQRSSMLNDASYDAEEPDMRRS